ncbi:MAG: hypothetical protein K5851_04900 [Lachnospiraceae bacterium]|nr:hypothetical protein [Lachnospiraceae bacterium]
MLPNIFKKDDEPKPFKPYNPLTDSGSPLIFKIVSKTPLFSSLIITGTIFCLVGMIGKFTFLSKFNNINSVKEPFFAISLFGIKDVLNGDQDLLLPSSILKKEETEELNKANLNAKVPSLSIPKSSCNKVLGATDYGVADRSIMVDDNYAFNIDKKGLFAPNGEYKKLVKSKNDDYFKDALFIGDSRMVGLYMFSNLKGKTNFFCRESTNVFNFPTRDMDYHGMNGEEGRTTIDNLLSSHKFKKIYISLGVNEMGHPSINYYKSFRNIIENLHNKQPDAYIFIMGSIHIAAPQCQTDPVFNNTNLVQRNKAISELANGRNIFYIDPNKDLCDKDGNLISEYTSDQIHLKANFYNLWANYIRENVVY